MFVLDNRLSFPANPGACTLHGYVGPYPRSGIAWGLNLQSEAVHSPLIPLAERGPGWDRVSCGVECRDLRLGFVEWLDLAAGRIEVSPDVSTCSFQLLVWEEIVSLTLKFSRRRGCDIALFAEGTAAISGFDAWFPDGRVPFFIDTWVRFTGLTVRAPLSETNQLAYASRRLEQAAPSYAHRDPSLQLAADSEGRVIAADVLFRPRESRPAPNRQTRQTLV